MLCDYRSMPGLGGRSCNFTTTALSDMFKNFVRCAMPGWCPTPRVEQVVNAFIDGVDPRYIAFESGYSKPHVGILLGKVARTVIHSDICRNYRQAYLDLKKSCSLLEEEYQTVKDKYARGIKIRKRKEEDSTAPFSEEEIRLFDFLATP